MSEWIKSFQKKELLNQALELAHHGKRAGYERLEFLGDRVVGVVVAGMLYDAFPKEKEGDMAKRFVALTRESTLAEIARKMGLPALLNTTEDELRENDSVLSDVCEAVMAALYLDKGLDCVKQVMKPLWMPYLKNTPKAPQDAKSAVQEWAQKKYGMLPTYQVIGRTGEDHNPEFTVQISVGKHKAEAVGSSKKNAEQAAAAALLAKVVKHG